MGEYPDEIGTQRVRARGAGATIPYSLVPLPGLEYANGQNRIDSLRAGVILEHEKDRGF